MYKWKCFFSYSSVCGHAAQIAVFCSFAALNSEKKKNILADITFSRSQLPTNQKTTTTVFPTQAAELQSHT